MGTLRDSLEYNIVLVSILVEVEYGCLVVHPVAVVRGGPEGDKLLIEPVDIPFLHQLMGPYDEVEVVQQVEVVHHLMSEDPSCPSRVPSPRLDILRI